MQRYPWRLVLVVAFLGLGTVASGQANSPSAEQLLGPKPAAHGVPVVYSSPAPTEVAQCKVEFTNTARGGAWVLKDPQGRLLRKFAYVGGSKTANEVGFYQDGVEVYREFISAGKQQADRFCWLGLGGMKIGTDSNGDGKIDHWQALSPEELAQEVVRTLANKDWAGYEALLVTEKELALLGAPAKEIGRIKELQQTAKTRFGEAGKRLPNLNASTKWLSLESGAPSRLLAEATGMKADVLMYYRALVLCDTAGKTDSILLGEIVRVGDCWKLLDAPMAADAQHEPIMANAGANSQPAQGSNPQLEAALQALAELDKKAPQSLATPAAGKYHLQRAEQIAKIFPLVKDEEKEGWYKQMVDSLAAAAQAGEPKALEQLEKHAAHLEKTQPASALAAYVSYRAINADYAMKSTGAQTPQAQATAQTTHLERLEKFVATYAKAEESAEALGQLGMILEFQNKEADAKKWYSLCAQNFPASKPGQKAAGALRRINLIGQTWELPPQVTSLAGGFNPSSLKGKTVVVYYWTTSTPQSAAEFRRLGEWLKEFGPKGLVVLAINVDDQASAAQTFIQQHKPEGIHLHATGGLDSPAVQHYALFVFPNMFLVGPDGKTLAHALDLSSLEAEVQKLDPKKAAATPTKK